MNALSVAEIERLRALVFQNSVELLEEADLLFQHKRFARAYTLAHLSSEELAKLPTLAWVGVRLLRGKTIDWKELDKTLRSHSAKLKGLLFFDLLGKGVEPTRKDIKVHRESLSRVDLFNEMKNASLYAGVYQGDLFKPNAVITEKCTTEMLTAARNRLEWYSKVEAITHDHLTELAKCQAYMRLLRILGIADAE